MAFSGPLSPATVVNDATVGTGVWSNPSNAATAGGGSASVALSSSTSQYLKATGFGFALPVDATVGGVVVEIARQGGGFFDNSVRLAKATGFVGTNKADGASEWPGTLAYATYGGATDLWGTTWTAAEVNATGFGTAIAAVAETDTASVDHIRVTVYYTEAPPVASAAGVRHPASLGAEAVIRVNVEGSWRELQPFWSLGVDATDHGPDVATFVCKQKLPKFTEVEVLIDGLTVGDGWVEENPTEDGVTTITAWLWQRHLDDDPYQYSYMVSGFGRATDMRAGSGAAPSAFAISDTPVDEKGMLMGISPQTVFYTGQFAGAIFDLGPGGMGARTVWLHQAYCNIPLVEGGNPYKRFVRMEIFVRTSSNRSLNPYLDGSGSGQTVGVPTSIFASSFTDEGPMWRGPFTLPSNPDRYVGVFIYNAGETINAAQGEYNLKIRLDQVRISMYPAPGPGTYAPRDNGSVITADMAIPHIVSKAPQLALGSVAQSAVDLHGLATGGYQTPRQMLDLANVDQWRYRVNPGRRLDYGPYPTLPTFTITDEASSRLAAPDKVSRVIVAYSNQSDDVFEVVRSVASPRQRTETMALGSPADAVQAGQIADAFMADQAQRKIEGDVTVPPGSLLERPSGMPLHPSRLLLAGGDRAYIDEEGEHGRIMGVSYTHDTETATVSIGQPPDELDRAQGVFDQWSMHVGNTSQA